MTYESGFMAGFLAGADRSVIPLLCGIDRAQAPDPLAQYQCYSASNPESVCELLSSCLRDAGLKPNPGLVEIAAAEFVAEFPALLQPVQPQPRGIEVMDRVSLTSVLAERLRDEGVKSIKLVTYTAEVDAGLIDQFHIRGSKDIDVYKRSILADLFDEQSTNLKRLARGSNAEPWRKRRHSINASERLSALRLADVSINQFLYLPPPSTRAYVFDDSEVFVAYYEVVANPQSTNGSIYKGITDAPALHLFADTADGQFELARLRNLMAGARMTSRSWEAEWAILLEGAPWSGPGRAPCVTPRLVMFDLDGALYDSLPQYVEAWLPAFAASGYEIPASVVYEHEGRNSERAIRMVLRDRTGDTPRDETVGAIRRSIHQSLDRMKPPPLMPGAQGLVHAVASSGVLTAVVTGSSRSGIGSWIERDFAGLLDARKLISGRKHLPGKPSAVPYLAALDEASTRCCDAIVIENGPLGVQAAVAANATCIAVNTGLLADEALERMGAAAVFRSVDELAQCWPTVIEISAPSLSSQLAW